MAGGGGEGASLEYTPTWVVAVVCTFIVAISLAAERLLHYAGKYLLKKNQGSLFQALQKIKEELMLLGFISLMLIVFQGRISEICISKDLASHWLPCKKEKDVKSTAHMGLDLANLFGSRHLLAEDSDSKGYCTDKGKTPLLSLKALHDLHIFIFVLAVSHIVFSAATIVLGGLKIRQWRHWEECIQKCEYDPEEAMKTKITHVKESAFVKGRISGIAGVALFSWTKSFCKQFYGSIKKSEYTTLRHGFIMEHCRSNPKFNFYKYMVRAFEKDFKKVVGISWHLWVFVVVFLLVNVHGWHAYFWISFIPLILLLAVGTKLEHIITELAVEVAHKHVAVEGDLVVRPSDEHFWFCRPRLVLCLIHVILFQNAFEIAVFFWMLVTFGFSSCIMGEVGYIIPRIVVGVFVQFLCSYSTLPLYAIVAQMGSSFNKAIFDEHIQTGLMTWAQKAKLKAKEHKSNGDTSSNNTNNNTNGKVANQESPAKQQAGESEIELN